MRLELESNPSSLPFTESSVRDEANQNESSEAREMLHEGIKAAQSGNRAQARVFLLRAADIDPRNESTWLWLASISEYPEELLVFLNNVLEINPSSERALEWTAATKSLLAKTFVQRGIDAFEANQSDSAAQYFNEALEYDQQNSMAWLWMASLSDSNEGKITYLEKVLSIDPDNQDAQMAFRSARHQATQELLAEAKAKAVAGKREESNDLLDAIIEESPDSEEAWILRSHLVDSFDEKISSYEKVLEINPENQTAKAGLASLKSIMRSVLPEVAESFVEEVVEESEAVGFDAAGEMVVDEEITAETDTNDESGFSESFASEMGSEAKTAIFTYKEEEKVEVHLDSVEETENAEHMFDSTAETVEEVQNVAEETVAESAGDKKPAEAGTPNSEAEPQMLESSEAADEANEVPVFHEDETAQSVDSFDSPTQYDEPTSEENDSMNNPSSPEAPETVEGSSNTFLVSPAVAETQSPFESLASNFETSEPPSREDRIPMPGAMLENLEDGPIPLSVGTRLDRRENGSKSQKALSFCPFCKAENEAHAFVCQGCMAVLTLSDLEMLIANPHADKFVLRQAIETMEREKNLRAFGENDLTMLGIGHLNLRNFQYGYSYLHEASQLNPDNVMLSSQVNALLIRLEEIKKQDEAHDSMPKGKTILVVDDSPTVRKLIAGKLEKCGHDVFCSSDGVEAMDRLQDIVPDLILLDITMPRMDGYQVCKLIRSNDATKDVPVIMISGNDGFFDKVRGRMAGTSGYITKPFGPETLMKAVESYLKSDG